MRLSLTKDEACIRAVRAEIRTHGGCPYLNRKGVRCICREMLDRPASGPCAGGIYIKELERVERSVMV